MVIRDWRPVDNVYAYYAQPYPPYYNVQRVLFWALVEKDCAVSTARPGSAEPCLDTSVVGLVSTPDGLVSALDVEPDEFVDYYRAGVDPAEIAKKILAEAQARGQELHQQYYPQAPRRRPEAGLSRQPLPEDRELPYSPVQPDPVLEVYDEPEPVPAPSPRRQRTRNRRPTSEE